MAGRRNGRNPARRDNGAFRTASRFAVPADSRRSNRAGRGVRAPARPRFWRDADHPRRNRGLADVLPDDSGDARRISVGAGNPPRPRPTRGRAGVAIAGFDSTPARTAGTVHWAENRHAARRRRGPHRRISRRDEGHRVRTAGNRAIAPNPAPVRVSRRARRRGTRPLRDGCSDRASCRNERRGHLARRGVRRGGDDGRDGTGR